MQTFNTNIEHLRAARLFTSDDKDVRHYLRGVRINDGHLVATNGLYLFAIPYPDLNYCPDIVIPNDAIDFFLKKTSKDKAGTLITIEIEQISSSEYKGVLRLANCIEAFIAIPHNNLPWRRIVSDICDKPTGEAQFEWSFLVMFEKAAKLLAISTDKGYRHAKLCPGAKANDPARVTLTSNSSAICVLAPRRV